MNGNQEPAVEMVPLEQVPSSLQSTGSSVFESKQSQTMLRTSKFSDFFSSVLDAPREIHVSPSGHRRFVLVLEDCQIITNVVNYLRSIADSFARSQSHSMVAPCLRLMVKVPAAIDHLTAEVTTGPAIFASLLELALEIRDESTEERRELYLCTILDRIVDWIHPDYPY